MGLPALTLTAVYTPAGTDLSGVDFSMFFAQMQAERSYSGAPWVRVRVPMFFSQMQAARSHVGAPRAASPCHCLAARSPTAMPGA